MRELLRRRPRHGHPPRAAAGAAAPAAAAPIAELDGRPFVLAIGTLERRKNLPPLVDAFGRSPPSTRRCALVLAGADGDDRPPIDAAIDRAAAGSPQRVLLTGRVDDATKAWLLRHARVLAYPSLDEGFGFPLLEAMQAGVPVVASDAGSIPEVAGDAALLVDPRDVDALAAALERGAHRRPVRDAAGRRRPTPAGRTFSWADTAAAPAPTSTIARRLPPS